MSCQRKALRLLYISKRQQSHGEKGATRIMAFKSLRSWTRIQWMWWRGIIVEFLMLLTTDSSLLRLIGKTILTYTYWDSFLIQGERHRPPSFFLLILSLYFFPSMWRVQPPTTTKLNFLDLWKKKTLQINVVTGHITCYVFDHLERTWEQYTVK